VCRLWRRAAARCWCTIPTWGNMAGIDVPLQQARARGLSRYTTTRVVTS
jgi:hypothetical protein